MNLAAIDIGTNSVRLLVVSADGRELARPMRMTRLGQGVDVTGTLADDALARTLSVLAEFRATLDGFGVRKLRVTATSAARDARNSAAFFDAAERVLGVRPELLSGAEEARLSFQGATQGLDPAGAPFLIVDLGGGSTELVLGSREPEALISLQMGCVRMTERHLKSDPPTPAELLACVDDVKRELGRARAVLDARQARTYVGLAGTVTALSALELGMRSYDASRTHHSRLTRAQVERGFERLRTANIAARRDMLAEPARAEVIVGGAAVLATLMQEFDIGELLVSEKDILDGLTASLT